MKSLFVSRLRLEAVERERDAALQREEYWRIRAEKLTDAALVRAGAVHEPTMEARVPKGPASALTSIITAMSVQEIDSSKSRKAAS